ncbi:hypothetical protein F4861DRAFT_545962 [Xylaria intraflava]|nr:hypothetical protein F4861DRAFT_545962 [Xylaria intraflava]
MAKSKPGLKAPSTAIDPTLNALFASSFGPVTAPSQDRYAAPLLGKEQQPAEHTRNRNSGTESGGSDEQDDESLSDLEGDGEAYQDDTATVDEEEKETEGDNHGTESDEETGANENEGGPVSSSKAQRKDHKRKRRDEYDDLEGNYMRKLAKEEEKEGRQEKRLKGPAGEAVETPAAQLAEDSEAKDPDDDEDQAALIHESLRKPDEHADVELDKANRTLFLGNVSIEAITSSKAKKTLISHLEAPLLKLDPLTGPHEIESLRFRSTPFSTGAKPKRAAFITKSVMSATTKSTNAYAVYSTPLASRTALKALNGSIILDRHLRVDSVAHPAVVDHRRCIFVGNLGFVDDETVVNTNTEGETVTKKRHKVPADTEEGLWRIFGEHAGKIESVRVPRDEKTRVGKGFAYVQFYDGNDVESAILLNGKKFPPMLPRVLRVSRAKDPRKTALAMERTSKVRVKTLKSADTKRGSTGYTPKITPEQQSQAGRAGKLFGRAAAAKQRQELKGGRRQSRNNGGNEQESGDGIKPPESFIFEGRRASAKDGKPKDLKFGKTKGKKGAVKAKAKGRGARRAAEWRQSKAS